MKLTDIGLRVSPRNPLDLVEEIVGAQDWVFERADRHELAVEIEGRWCDHRLYFRWEEEVAALHFSCLLDSRIPAERRREIHSLLAMVNEKMWLGHFDLSSEAGIAMFRHTQLLRGANGVSVEQMEDLIEVAVNECDRFFPAFQYVIWGGQSAPDAMSAALLDIAGEA